MLEIPSILLLAASISPLPPPAYIQVPYTVHPSLRSIGLGGVRVRHVHVWSWTKCPQVALS